MGIFSILMMIGVSLSLRKKFLKQRAKKEKFYDYDFSDEFRKSEKFQRQNFLLPINAFDANVVNDGTVKIISKSNHG